VRTIQLDLLFTILAALVVYFTGRALTARSAFLKRFSIPAPVVGGVLVAILLALADGLGGVRISFDMSLRDNLLLMFFTTVGLSADARMLLRGGPKLATFLVVSIAFIAVQNLVGLGAAFAMDLHPVVGLLGGSVTLTGGHGTGAAYGARFGDTMNIAGAMELTMACATSGLVLGSVLGGPLAQYLVKRYRLSPAPAAVQATEAEAGEAPDEITVQSVMTTLVLILACLAGGKTIARAVSGTGLILPDFLFCLLFGVAIRNGSTLLKTSHVWLLAPTWIAVNAVLGLFTTQTIFQLVKEPNPKFADQLLMTVEPEPGEAQRNRENQQQRQANAKGSDHRERAVISLLGNSARRTSCRSRRSGRPFAWRRWPCRSRLLPSGRGRPPCTASAERY